MNAPQQPHPAPTFGRYIGGTIFFSRWLQAPLYLGLIIAQVVYVAHFGKELQHLVADFNHLSEADIMLIVLGLVDVVMIANLLIMVIIGGYETFVSRIRMSNHPDQPEWLSHVNPNVLKVKLAMAIIGISSVHLLKTFIEAGKVHPAGHQLAGQPIITGDTMMWQTLIHLAFIASAVALAYIDWLSQKSLTIQNATHAPAAEPAPGPAEAPAAASAPASGSAGGAPVAAPVYATAAPVATPAASSPAAPAARRPGA
ncbi:MAG: TIGR00645 family protein [Patulibacter sp.]|nr:TIGR00645 family protein [Patulibacter sp.]